jgi:hypothetical protein
MLNRVRQFNDKGELARAHKMSPRTAAVQKGLVLAYHYAR